MHVNGEGKYGICGTDCNPTISLASILAGLGINTQTRAAQFTQSQAERIMGSWQILFDGTNSKQFKTILAFNTMYFKENHFKGFVSSTA